MWPIKLLILKSRLFTFMAFHKGEYNMTYNELNKIIEESNENDWIKKDGILIYKNDLNISILLSNNAYSRKNDEILNEYSYDEFFEKYNSDLLIDVKVLFGQNIVINYTWLYKPDVVIPLPVGANMITDFFENEHDIAKLLSENEDLFNALLANVTLCKKS